MLTILNILFLKIRKGKITGDTASAYIHHEAAARKHTTELALMTKLGTCRCMVSRRHQHHGKVPSKMEYRGDRYGLDRLSREYIN
jgi:hypothetical protein